MDWLILLFYQVKLAVWSLPPCVGFIIFPIAPIIIMAGISYADERTRRGKK